MFAKRVLKNAIYNSTSVLIGNLAGLVISIYVARVLKAELFGIYSLALSLAFLLLTFTDLGVNATVVRYVSYAYGKGDKELVRGYIRNLSKFKLLLVLVVSSLLFLSSDFLSEAFFNKPALSLPLKVVSGYIVFYSLSGYVNSIFNAFNDFRANLVRSGVYEVSRIAFVFLFLLLGFSVAGALFGFVIAAFLSFFVLAILLFRSYGEFLYGRAKGVNWRRVVRFTGYLTLGSITWTVFAYVDSVMIGMLLAAAEVGYYRAAYNIVGAVAGLVSLPVVLFPVFVYLEGEDLKNAFDRLLKYASILAFPAAFGLAVISEPLIRFVYGPEYLPAVPVMWILALLILRSGMGFWGVLFNAKEMPEYPVYASFAGMVMNVVLNYFMILSFGIAGAALATVLSNTFVWSSLAALSSRKFGISVKTSYILKPMLSSALMAYMLYYVGFNTLLDAIFKIFAGAGIYFLLLYLLRGFKREDWEYLESLLR